MYKSSVRSLKIICLGTVENRLHEFYFNEFYKPTKHWMVAQQSITHLLKVIKERKKK
jgi:hypothetical protein